MPLIGLATNPSQNVPNMNSEYSAWMQWHMDMADRYGLKVANELFMKAWNKRRPTSWSSSIDIINKNKLIQYLKQNGISVDENAIQTLTGWSYSIVDSIASTLNIGKYLVYAIIGIVLIFLAIFLFNIARRPDIVTGAASKAFL